MAKSRANRQRVRRRYVACCTDGMCLRDVDVKVSDPEIQRIIDGCTPEEKCYFMHRLMGRGLVGGVRVQDSQRRELATWGPPGAVYPR